MTENNATVEVANDEDAKKLEERGKELMEQLTNKDKRAAVRYFDCAWEDLDGLDQMVLMAHIADRSRSLEDYDAMPLMELQKVVIGE